MATTNKNLSPSDLLAKGMNPKRWKYKTDNKMRGAFGETNFNTKTIRINKKKHTDKKLLAKERHYNRNPDGSEKIIDTIVHELEHKRDPKATEKQVVKRAKKKTAKMSTLQKKKIYALFNK